MLQLEAGFQYGELCMIGPTWSPCSQFVPMYEHAVPGHLYVPNIKLETVMSFSSNQCAHNHAVGYGCHGGFLCVWAPDSTLVACADRPDHVSLCWHSSGQHPGKAAQAARVSALLAELSATESLEYLIWSPCGGLAAATLLHNKETRGKCPVLHVSMPGQPPATMKAGSGERESIIWSPAGDRLLVDSYDLQLVTSKCVTVHQFDRSTGCFSPCSHFVCVIGGSDISVRVCRASDGSLIFSLIGCSTRHGMPSFNYHGDVIILTGSRGIRVICFGWGPNLGTAYGQQMCISLAAAGDLAIGLSHSCCNY